MNNPFCDKETVIVKFSGTNYENVDDDYVEVSFKKVFEFCGSLIEVEYSSLFEQIIVLTNEKIYRLDAETFDLINKKFNSDYISVRFLSNGLLAYIKLDGWLYSEIEIYVIDGDREILLNKLHIPFLKNNISIDQTDGNILVLKGIIKKNKSQKIILDLRKWRFIKLKKKKKKEKNFFIKLLIDFGILIFFISLILPLLVIFDNNSILRGHIKDFVVDLFGITYNLRLLDKIITTTISLFSIVYYLLFYLIAYRKNIIDEGLSGLYKYVKQFAIFTISILLFFYLFNLIFL